MIEVLPSEISRGIQLVGLEVVEGRKRPSCALLAVRMGKQEGALCLRGIWLGPEGDVFLRRQALWDLVREGISEAHPPDGRWALALRCKVCGGDPSPAILLPGARAVCPGHLADLWDQAFRRDGMQPSASSCPQCGRSAPILWSEGGQDRCSGCLSSSILNRDSSRIWLFLNGAPAPREVWAELRLFAEAWKRVSRCERCHSEDLRLRKLMVECPRSPGPLYPLWELRREDATSEAETRRIQQLKAYTEGLMRVTIECPQCGYLERALPGLEALGSFKRKGSRPPLPSGSSEIP